MGERLALAARRRSSRSVVSLGMVCSWGRTSVPAGSTPRAPMTPVVTVPPGSVIR